MAILLFKIEMLEFVWRHELEQHALLTQESLANYSALTKQQKQERRSQPVNTLLSIDRQERDEL